MRRTDGIRKEPGNRPTRVDGVGPCPLAGTRARTRRIEDGETAMLGPDESVAHIAGITAESHDCPIGGDVQGEGAPGRAPPGASKVVIVCADSGMNIATATRTIAAQQAGVSSSRNRMISYSIINNQPENGSFFEKFAHCWL